MLKFFEDFECINEFDARVFFERGMIAVACCMGGFLLHSLWDGMMGGFCRAIVSGFGLF